MAEKKPGLPNAKYLWEKSLKLEGVSAESIHHLNEDSFRSASKIQIEQYLLLRVLWKPKLAESFKVSDWLDPETYTEAREYLDKNICWEEYLALMEQSGMKSLPLPAKTIGTFSTVHYQQSRIYSVEEDYREKYDTPKISFRTDDSFQSPEASPLKGKSPEEQLGQTQPRYHTRATTRSEDPFNFKRPVDAMSLKLKKLILTGSPKTPYSPDLTSPLSTGSVMWTASPLEVISPMDPALMKPASDEQVVNMALVSFLQALTAFHPKVRVHWAIDRKKFYFSNFFEAWTDGVLISAQNKYPLAILEVKSHLRKKNKDQIQMQESAQMAAWIYSHPDNGHLAKSSNGFMRRVIISQDHHEIYLTFAEYDQAYVDYLKPGNKADIEKALAKNPFMTMHQFGPWPCSNRSLMNMLGAIILGLTLEQGENWDI